MAQLSYSLNPSVAYEGGLADQGFKDVISKINSTNELILVTVVNAVNSAVYTINVNDGINAAANATYTADGSATKTEAVNGLISAINALALKVKCTVVSLTGGTFNVELEDESAAGSLTLLSTGDTPSDVTFSVKVAQGQEIPFGRFVCLDEARGDGFARLPRVSGDVGGLTFGVVLAASARQPNAGGFPHASVLPVLNKGRVWMRVEDVATVGAAVYVRYTANGAGLPGMVRSDGDSSKAAALAKATFKSSGGAGALVIVELA